MKGAVISATRTTENSRAIIHTVPAPYLVHDGTMGLELKIPG